MSAAGSIVGFIEVCTTQDPVTFACTGTAWMPPPGGIPIISMEYSMQLFGWSAAVLACAWGWKQLARTIRW